MRPDVAVPAFAKPTSTDRATAILRRKTTETGRRAGTANAAAFAWSSAYGAVVRPLNADSQSIIAILSLVYDTVPAPRNLTILTAKNPVNIPAETGPTADTGKSVANHCRVLCGTCAPARSGARAATIRCGGARLTVIVSADADSCAEVALFSDVYHRVPAGGQGTI